MPYFLTGRKIEGLRVLNYLSSIVLDNLYSPYMILTNLYTIPNFNLLKKKNSNDIKYNATQFKHHVKKHINTINEYMTFIKRMPPQ